MLTACRHFGINDQNPALWTYVGKDGNYGLDVSLPDLLADDWEVREKTVTITRNQLIDAYNAAWTASHGDAGTINWSSDMRFVLAKKLGLVD